MPEHTPAPTPARSLYGFFLYLFSKTLLVIYICWAIIPDQYLHHLHIYYYPQKYWATAIPIQLLIALTLFTFIIYPSSNLMLVPDINSMDTITDSHALYTKTNSTKLNIDIPAKCVCRKGEDCYKDDYKSPPVDMHDNTVPPLQDLSISFVCKKLYLKNKFE